MQGLYTDFVARDFLGAIWGLLLPTHSVPVAGDFKTLGGVLVILKYQRMMDHPRECHGSDPKLANGRRETVQDFFGYSFRAQSIQTGTHACLKQIRCRYLKPFALVGMATALSYCDL